jgi:hypothetical protein
MSARQATNTRDPLVALEALERRAYDVYERATLKHDRAEGRLMRKKIDFRLPAVRRRHGLNTLETARDATLRAWQGVRLKMAATKAATVAGIAVKLRHLAWDVPTGMDDADLKLLESVLADAERLAKGGAT